MWRAPRTGILLWQLLALTWVLCLVGSLFAIGLSPYGTDIPSACARLFTTAAEGLSPVHISVVALGLALLVAVLVALVMSWVAVSRLRHRHRSVLALVARRDPAGREALVVDHPLAVAYCVPGLRGNVVLSSGALDMLTDEQVAAVVAHERTHLRERHDLVLLPFTVLRRLMPRIRLVALAVAAVGLLVEMRADEGACRGEHAGALSTALRRFSVLAVSPPPGTLGVADAAISARLDRIRDARPLPRVFCWLVLVTGLVLVSTPVSFLIW
ncbi:M56 family metallopeptidase [Actinocrispum sp. NPDC049592]|uniref:M56 family metallopeptidase n=1 Tax=Actinocrispum sp. NPDC049592 TaxID=3154835 RepID=UPI00342380DE